MPVIVKHILVWLGILTVIGGAILALLYWSATPFPPRLVNGLTPNSHGDHPAYQARLREVFPEGTTRIQLIETLQRQGFSGPHRHEQIEYMNHDAPGLPCKYITRVSWQTDDHGRVQNVGGIYGTACL